MNKTANVCYESLWNSQCYIHNKIGWVVDEIVRNKTKRNRTSHGNAAKLTKY